MSGLKFSFKAGPSKPKRVFATDSGDEDVEASATKLQPKAVQIVDFDAFAEANQPDPGADNRRKDGVDGASIPAWKRGRPAKDAPPPKLKPKNPPAASLGDLSSSLASRKHAQAAEALDPSVYDYDGVYDSLQATKKAAATAASGDDGEERRPRYMNKVMAAAAVRKRDGLIAEEKRIAREREAEGDEYAGTERFVTEAYKKQQEENRRLEEEERLREEREAKSNKTGGMAAFYKKLLDSDERRHAQIVKAVEEKAAAVREGRDSGTQRDGEQVDEEEAESRQAKLAREINARGGSVAVNEDGQVVDARELLRGGLNVVPKPKRDAHPKPSQSSTDERRDRGPGGVYQHGSGGKQAMRDRQTRMMEAQLEQSLKRSLDAEEEERQRIERAAKTRKTTEADISSAKERYLARKREAEEAKKREAAGGG